MRKDPRLAIGIPVYNGEAFLDELLNDLRGQTFSDFEIVISDNASTDRTEAICRAHAAADERVKYFRADINRGANPNFDRAFRLSRAPYFMWAAHDDLHDSTFAEKCVALLDANPDVVLAHSGVRYINAAGQTIEAADDKSASGAELKRDSIASGEADHPVVRFADVLFSNSYCHELYGVFRRSALEQTKLIDRKYYASDKALLLEMTLLGRYLHVREPLFIKRYHQGMSGALSMAEAKKWAHSGDGVYSWRLRKLADYLSTPRGKPIGTLSKAACLALVFASAARILSIVTLKRIGLFPAVDEVKAAALGATPHASRSEDADETGLKAQRIST
ncbi:glycosyltransferase family 2 protein [Hyphomicrobium sp.]|uniref:glycosyltransferase family 2 protein n=1 Tax=Hyphomicrobium sp. TaxID=82 RepID=UPI003F71C043